MAISGLLIDPTHLRPILPETFQLIREARERDFGYRDVVGDDWT